MRRYLGIQPLLRAWRAVYQFLWEVAEGYVDHNALSRGAAISYYTVFSMGPMLVLAIAIAGAVFGQDAARGAIASELSRLMGADAAQAVQQMIKEAHYAQTGYLATIIGVITLVASAGGVFGEVQAALNAVWRIEPHAAVAWRMFRSRIAGLAVVLAIGAILMASIVISLIAAALSTYLTPRFPETAAAMWMLNVAASFSLQTLLFGTLYKALPDRDLAWRDVAVGAILTSILFTSGRSVLSMYIGTSHLESGYGAAGAIVVMMIWVYYSAQIFLIGAECTRVSVERWGRTPAPSVSPDLPASKNV